MFCHTSKGLVCFSFGSVVPHASPASTTTGHGTPPPTSFFQLFVARCKFQLRSLALPVVEEAAAEHAHGVHQGIIMGLVVLLRVCDVVVDKVTSSIAVRLVSSNSLIFSGSEGGVIDCRTGPLWFWRRWGCTGKQKQGQDGGVLPVEQADDFPDDLRTTISPC